MATTTTTTTAPPVLKLRQEDNPCWTSKTSIIRAASDRLLSEQYAEGDWRKKLIEDGYVVIKNVIPEERALQYQKGCRDILSSFGTPLDYNDKSTWKHENLPDPSDINTFTLHGIAHEKAVWDVRKDKNVRDVFAKLWGTNELLVSFDALNVTFPGRHDQPTQYKFWPHTDQSPYREGMECVQGIVALSEAGPKDGGLMVYKGSHNLFNRYFEERSEKDDKTKWHRLDNVRMSEDDIKWYLDNGCEEIKVCCGAGDVILWDSRTVHYGKGPEDDSDVVRTLVYSCYTPASWATEEALELKKKAFYQYQSTTHWPHTNLISDFEPWFPNGNVTPRTEPYNKIDYNDEEILKLAGVKSY